MAPSFQQNACLAVDIIAKKIGHLMHVTASKLLDLTTMILSSPSIAHLSRRHHYVERETCSLVNLTDG